MACNTCNTKFNFFHKEMGCANCGMSFCNKCLKQKCVIPSKGPTEYNVCRICFNKLTSMNGPDYSTLSAPDTFLKRLENLENPSAPPITVYKQNPKYQKLRTGLTPKDQKLVDRLESLKGKKPSPPPSETELRKRLADLKGEKFVDSCGKSFLPPIDNRTNQEKADNLLEQFINERDIELQHNPQEEIEARLATLREKGVRPNEGPYVQNLHDSDDSEEEISKITRKVMDEVALEDKTSTMFTKDASTTEEAEVEDNLNDADVLPWCVLCNDDARYKCFDCGGDLYCASCNEEVHKRWDRDHKVVPFKGK
ncbi:hypothetical protein HHI36_003407 [Cryptolaemus montrouzieri]|uniref:FYVE-type domain-containing protein n=1 Tax=Cryptolaemus montrouzieri TaxID=559131 RepID=A0ABD2PDB0_9CUCU